MPGQAFQEITVLNDDGSRLKGQGGWDWKTVYLLPSTPVSRGGWEAWGNRKIHGGWEATACETAYGGLYLAAGGSPDLRSSLGGCLLGELPVGKSSHEMLDIRGNSSLVAEVGKVVAE